jgi:D-alanine-D-alanine ligase-like ATP-grasp enzyme
VAEILNKKCSLYTLDFIVSNSGNAYLLEGNTNPGLDWNVNLPENEIEAKKLINLVVEELKNRVRLNK